MKWITNHTPSINALERERREKASLKLFFSVRVNGAIIKNNHLVVAKSAQ